MKLAKKSTWFIILFVVLDIIFLQIILTKYYANDYNLITNYVSSIGIDKNAEIGKYKIDNAYTNDAQAIYTSRLSLNELNINIYKSMHVVSAQEDYGSNTSNYLYSGGIFLEAGAYPNGKRLEYFSSTIKNYDIKHIKVVNYEGQIVDKKITIQLIDILDADGYWKLGNRQIKNIIVILTLHKKPHSWQLSL